MRFDKETRAAIHEAAPSTAIIRWPTGAAEPQKDRVYWMQSLEAAQEAAEKAKQPETCAEVMAQMHERRYGQKPEGFKPRRRGSTSRPRGDDPRIMVLDVEILERGWNATVALYEDPDPKRHTGIKARVPAGPNPIFGHQEPTETEPEAIVTVPSRSEREDAERALEIEHAASVDEAEIAKAARKLADQRRKGKSGKQARAALERARRRAELASAECAV